MRIVVPIFAVGLVIAACGVKSGAEAPQGTDPPPREAVAVAAERTFTEPVTSLGIPVDGDAASWAGMGLVDLAGGRFRVTAQDEANAVTVIGLTGEGFEGTVEETVGGPLGMGDGERRCWMNPHAPVGFYADPISVEEAVHVTGSVVESLRGEIASAQATGDNVYEVRLEASAREPENDFHDGDRRVWGDRALLGDLTQPIEVELADGRIAALTIQVVHTPDQTWLPADRHPREVRLDASLEPTDHELALDPPHCQAIE